MPLDSYVLGRSDAETKRLILQHRIYGPITRRLFEAAGIGAGMKVLDIGSGAGDVSLLLADLVGPRGQVMGVDLNPGILATAQARADAAGAKNVTFWSGDARDVIHVADFDAVVGRWVLMYVPGPAQLMRQLSSLLKPGGIMAFQEIDLSNPPASFPPTELSTQLQRWSVPPAGVPGPDARIGTKLFRLFTEAGLPEPEMRMEAPIGGGPDWPGYEYSAETLRSLLPALQHMMGLDPAKVEIDTLAARLRTEAEARQSIQMLPLIVGAWSRKA